MYKIVRFYRDFNRKSKIIKTSLTLEEAQEHCQREDTHGDGWFDGYEKEYKDIKTDIWPEILRITKEKMG